MTMTGQEMADAYAPVADELRNAWPRIEVTSEPLTYRRDVRASFYRDLLISTPAGDERLARHRQEMDVVHAERERRANQRLHSGEIEYRVEPNTTQGYGGYFAPPLWLNEYFATAPRSLQVLAPLIPMHFPLPPGVSSINLPILSTGTQVRPTPDGGGVDDRDIVDATGSSTVVTLSSQADVALQLLEQSPAGAHLDWALFKDMTESYDSQVESQLYVGLGSAAKQILGLANVTSNIGITYTDASPTGHAMYTYFGEAVAQVGDARKVPPECWLMRTARYAWLMASEDGQNRPLMTPDPIVGVASILGFPVFLSDAIPATLGATANQDEIFAVRPSDLMLFEGEPQTSVYTEVLSGTLSARIQMHAGIAAITNRYPSGIAVMTGTGLVVQSGS